MKDTMMNTAKTMKTNGALCALLASALLLALALAAPSALADGPAGLDYDETDVALAHDKDVRTFRFEAGKLAMILVDGDGDTDLDLYVYDSDGDLVASDEDGTDLCRVAWIPGSTGRCRVEVVNRGGVGNRYRIAVKRFGYTKTDVALGHGTDVRTFRLEAGKRATVLVKGDGDTDLDVRVYNERGRLVASDLDGTDLCLAGWVADRTGLYKVEVVNRGRVCNRYMVAVAAD